MPIAMRKKDKAEKISRIILGPPANEEKKKSNKKKSKIEKKLIFEESKRI